MGGAVMAVRAVNPTPQTQILFLIALLRLPASTCLDL